MNAVKHIEFLDRSGVHRAIPSPYMVQREVDRMAATIAQQAGRLYTSEQMAQQHTAGVTEGWRQARWWLAGNTGALIAFGVCVGVTLTIFVGPMVAFIF